MMEQMTLNDLKTGMHVVTRDGIEWVVLKDTMFCDKDILVAVHEDDVCCSWFSLKVYNQNMTTTDRKLADLDIVRVYQPSFEYTSLEYSFDICPDSDLAVMLFAEETMTRAIAEQKLGVRIID